MAPHPTRPTRLVRHNTLSSMKALVVSDQGTLELADVPQPEPSGEDVLVAVRAISLNRGELHRLADSQPGWRPGWDFAGHVATASAARESPPEGARVFGFSMGGSWAEYVAVPPEQLATLPDEVSFDQAAALPVVGLTALRTLSMAGDLTGKRVLVIGASGGVGHFAIQLARRMGAEVTGIVRRAVRAEEAMQFGDATVTTIDRIGGEYDVILESAGGDSLRRALELVAPRGVVITFGNSSRQETTFLVNDFYAKQAMLRGFFLLDEIATQPLTTDLADLAKLVADGELAIEVGQIFAWEDAAAALEALRQRSVSGKVVLRVADTT